MSGLGKSVLVLSLVVLLAVLGGCTAARTLSQEPPNWVRIVVPERDGRSLFVGGSSFAIDAEAGVKNATDDALSQVHLAATHRFTELFTRAIRESGAETTAMERLDVKGAITDDYGHLMVEVARQDSVYSRPCGDAAGASASPVCQVFVLMSVDTKDWGARLGELLVVQKRRYDEEGNSQLVRFVEWLTRQALDGQPEGRPEGARERTP